MAVDFTSSVKMWSRLPKQPHPQQECNKPHKRVYFNIVEAPTIVFSCMFAPTLEAWLQQRPRENGKEQSARRHLHDASKISW
jgi:hypothetical protein